MQPDVNHTAGNGFHREQPPAGILLCHWTGSCPDDAADARRLLLSGSVIHIYADNGGARHYLPYTAVYGFLHGLQAGYKETSQGHGHPCVLCPDDDTG